MYNVEITEKTLDNGLKVILVYKEGYQKSLFSVAAPCGGFDIAQMHGEELVEHLTGCAHYLEHQMFRLNGEDVTESFATMQAQTNAYTSYTETCYYFQTTADVKEPLSLLLEFVETLDIDFDSVEKEKGIIINEYDMYQQSPEQRLLKETYKSLYKNHPIHIDILGHREDIKKMTVGELTRFYNVNYDPSRLVLVGITGKDTNEILSFVEEHQKAYPSKIEFVPSRYYEQEQDTVVRESFEDTMDITNPFVCVGYKMDCSATVMDALKKDLSVQMRLDSLFSPMNPDYQNWLDERIVTQVAGAECDFSVDRGYILFYAQTSKMDEFVNLVDSIMHSLIHDKMCEEDFEALQASYIGQNIRSLDQFDNFSLDLIRAYFEKYDFWDNFNLIKELNIDSIYDVCQTLNMSNKTITKILPK